MVPEVSRILPDQIPQDPPSAEKRRPDGRMPTLMRPKGILEGDLRDKIYSHRVMP